MRYLYKKSLVVTRSNWFNSSHTTGPNTAIRTWSLTRCNWFNSSHTTGPNTAIRTSSLTRCNWFNSSHTTGPNTAIRTWSLAKRLTTVNYFLSNLTIVNCLKCNYVITVCISMYAVKCFCLYERICQYIIFLTVILMRSLLAQNRRAREWFGTKLTEHVHVFTADTIATASITWVLNLHLLLPLVGRIGCSFSPSVLRFPLPCVASWTIGGNSSTHLDYMANINQQHSFFFRPANYSLIQIIILLSQK